MIKCKVCGKWLKWINRAHLKTHNMTVEQYKEIFNTDELIDEDVIRRLASYGMKGKHHSEESKLKLKQANKGKKPSQNTIDAVRISNRERIVTKETREKLSEANSGEDNPMFRRHHTKESKEKMSITRKEKYAKGETKIWNKGKKGLNSGENNPMYGKHHTKEAKQKISIVHKNKVISIKTRGKISVAHKKLWKNKEYREKTIKSILKGLMKRPTSYEQKIINLCSIFDLQYKYVGDGKILIGYKNPDFIECNGKKLLIEVYHDYKRGKPYEEKRYKIFIKYGYKTLFLKDDDLCNKLWFFNCLEDIINFK